MGDLIGGLTTLSVHHSAGMKPLAGGDNQVGGTPLEIILGMEGFGSAAYFRCFGKLLSDQKQWPFPGRVKRPPTDPINALLSFGELAAHQQGSQCCATGRLRSLCGLPA